MNTVKLRWSTTTWTLDRLVTMMKPMKDAMNTKAGLAGVPEVTSGAEDTYLFQTRHVVIRVSMEDFAVDASIFVAAMLIPIRVVDVFNRVESVVAFNLEEVVFHCTWAIEMGSRNRCRCN